MRTRIVGAFALLLGLLVLVIVANERPLPWKPLLGGLGFAGFGAYYLFSGRKAATLKEFVVDGKLAHDDARKDASKDAT